MDRDQALALLESENARERLEAARFLEHSASTADADAIRAARTVETVAWIRDSLTRALNLATAGGAGIEQPETPRSETDDEDLDAIYAAALRDVADQIVHELDPLVGAARLHAAEELAAMPGSKTRRDIDRIAAVLKAVDELARAAAAPVITDFNLSDVVAEAVGAAPNDDAITVQLAGSDPFPCRGDPVLIHIALRNGLANAIEATQSMNPSAREPIVVSWGRRAAAYRITVLDRGPGPPADLETLVDLGVTTKGGDHPGLGLTLARRAARSLRGGLSLTDAEPRGALFELTWPREVS
jgi:signal transduction histidine kinase